MRMFSSHHILQVWEQGEHLHRLDRDLLLLGAASGMPWAALAALVVGERDQRLLRLRQQVFGSHLEGMATCPKCSESLEFNLDTQQLIAAEVPEVNDLVLERDGYRLGFRLPNSHDLAAVTQASSPDVGRQILLERCIEAQHEGQAVEVQTLPEELLEAVETRMTEVDPSAETLLDFECPACHHAWNSALDIGGFLWHELRLEARRLLSEVHVLATAYGWSEQAILNLSESRRQAYLAQVLA
jgi:hypothetical protein